MEAANSIAVQYPRYQERHVNQLYARLRQRKGHSKAIGAVARHLAEAAFHVLHGQQPYRDPAAKAGCAREAYARRCHDPGAPGSRNECDPPPAYFSCPTRGRRDDWALPVYTTGFS